MKVIIFFCLVCLSLNVLGQSNPVSVLDKIDKKIEAQMYDGALVIAEKVIEKNKLSDSLMAVIYLRLSTIYSLKEQRGIAIDVLKNGFERFPDHFLMAYSYGHINVRSARNSIAKKYYHKSINLAKNWKDSMKCYYLLSSVYMYQQNWDSTIAVCNYVLKRMPKSVTFLNELGMVHIFKKDYNQGIPVFRKLMKIDSSDESTFMNMGMLYTYKKSYDSSIYFYKRALEINPESGFTYSNLGFCYHSLEDYNQAIIYYNKSIKLNPKNSWVYKNKGITYISLKRSKEACKYLNLSKDLGYKEFYGDEVNQLLKEHCQE